MTEPPVMPKAGTADALRRERLPNSSMRISCGGRGTNLRGCCRTLYGAEVAGEIAVSGTRTIWLAEMDKRGILIMMGRLDEPGLAGACAVGPADGEAWGVRGGGGGGGRDRTFIIVRGGVELRGLGEDGGSLGSSRLRSSSLSKSSTSTTMVSED